MEIGEIGQVGLAVVSVVVVVQILEQDYAIAQVHQTAETTVLDPLLNFRAATLIYALVS